MPKEFVINELSIEDFGEWKGDVLTLIEALEGLWTAIHPLRQAGTLWMWGAVRQEYPAKTQENIYLGRMIKAALGTGATHRDRARRAIRLFDLAVTFDDDVGEEVLLTPNEGRVARGLGHARRLDALAVSLATARAWNRHSIPVTVRTLAPSGSLQAQDAQVPHAAHPAHIHEHRAWLGLADIQRLRLQLAIATPRHEAASHYSHGKHVRGQTNEERRDNARRAPRGESQYFATLPNGAPVTDATIQQWETKALDRVRTGESCTVVPRGEGFWVYCDLGEPVGYIGAPEGDDEPTSWVRVECSSGTVHSHPRCPPLDPAHP
ncbi:uncharacterized protein SOCEGT47_033410 [Sorangium cellulosum]|uniref:Uncharacterized protein n=1 Tax=Sorangium cellulosum TaxID=56 RepID=A0A4P2Q1K5_SORCE|nr:hypothetical protein [Sorangium cellulosum]AUX22828.1 uncharacterized protein SOCEGT47_033410 [Sorangium cellulosum]